MKRKPDNVEPRYCERCGVLLERKRFPSGIEAPSSYSTRRFCSHECVGATRPSKIPIEKLKSLYAKHGSVHKVGEIVGLNGASVHERLQKAGVTKNDYFTEEEVSRIKREYSIYRDAGKLEQLAKSMGRTKTGICCKAKKLGLTDKNTKRKYNAVWKYMTEDAARVIFEKFKKSRLGMGQFCKRHGYDDLGFARTLRAHFPDEWEHVIEAKVPRQTMYRIGRTFEYRVRDELKENGYFVMRSPRSGSPVDLVAIKPGSVLFVQCKRGAQLHVKDWNELYDLALATESLPIMASTPKGRGIEYHLLVGKKDGSKRRQPMEAWKP